MAYPSVTFTFTNGTTASASQMNQNLTDLINGMSDATKDFSINALTTAGTATFNGNVNIGNASSDDLSITASLASSLAIKTNNSFDIGGAGLGLASLYLGAPSSRSTRITAHQSLSGSNTLILPDGNGTAYDTLQTDGSGNLSWATPRENPSVALNYSLSCSVGSNALTITLKGADGNDLSSTNVFRCSFRSTTLSSGVFSMVNTTSNLSIVISSGSTLGHGDGFDSSIWVYALNNSGTVELAVSNVYFDERFTWSTTAEGGAGGADTGGTLYSTTARTSKAIKLLGRIVSNQTTAGTWATTPQYINLGGLECNPNLIVYQPTLQNNHGDWNQWIGQFEYVRLFTNTGTPYYSLKFAIDGYSSSSHANMNWAIPGIQIKAAVSGHVPACGAGSTADVNQIIWVYQIYSAGVSYITASVLSGSSASQYGITGQILLDAVPKWA